jgi:hypothetical protein
VVFLDHVLTAADRDTPGKPTPKGENVIITG